MDRPISRGRSCFAFESRHLVIQYRTLDISLSRTASTSRYVVWVQVGPQVQLGDRHAA